MCFGHQFRSLFLLLSSRCAQRDDQWNPHPLSGIPLRQGRKIVLDAVIDRSSRHSSVLQALLHSKGGLTPVCLLLRSRSCRRSSCRPSFVVLRPSVDGCTGFLSLTLLRGGFSTVAVAALTAVQTTRYVQRVRERVLLIFLDPFALLATQAPSRSVSTCFSSRSKCST